MYQVEPVVEELVVEESIELHTNSQKTLMLYNSKSIHARAAKLHTNKD